MTDTMDRIDDVTGGMLTAPYSDGRPQYNIKDLDEYARRIGKDTSALSDFEISQFLVRENVRKTA